MEKEEDKYHLTPSDIRRLEERVKQIRKELRSLTDPIRESARLSARDYMIVINSPPLELPADYDFSQSFRDY